MIERKKPERKMIYLWKVGFLKKFRSGEREEKKINIKKKEKEE